MKGNAIVAQSGGPTAVINASACGVIQEAFKHSEIEGVYAAHNGILGVLNEEIFDLGREDPSAIEQLKTTPASALGSCRYKVKTQEDFERIVSVFKKYDIRYFFYIGGNDSMDTADKLGKLAADTGYELGIMGIPKTIDNDIRGTDYCIGFQTAVEIATEALDRLRSTAESHHRVMLLEVMGRHAGWIATYAGMANGADAILIPEIPLDEVRLGELCKMLLNRNNKGINFSVVVAAEGTILEGKTIVRESPELSDYGKRQLLGGVGRVLGEIIEKRTGLETRVSSLDYIQRGGTPVAYDRSLATAFGVKAFNLLQQEKYGEMAAIKGNRITSSPLAEVAKGIKSVYINAYMIAERFFG